jgi:uncharacterized membrane protein
MAIPVKLRTQPTWGHIMKTQKRAQDIYEIGDRLANDRHARRSALKAADSATAVSDDLKHHGFRHVALSDRTAHHLGVIAEAAGDIARRSAKPRHRRWPWLVGAGAVAAGGAAAIRLRGGTTTVVGASSSGRSIVSAVDVDVPVRAAYDQWTQFEAFPRYPSSIDELVQLADTHLRWTAGIGGVKRTWTAEVTEQLPDERVAWKSHDGGPSGVVTFHRLDEDRCRVTVQIGYEPDGLREQAGSLLGIDSIQVQQDLRRFKELVEAGVATGAWRGTVDAPA